MGFYGDAALRAKHAGFDMVEVHAGHRHGLGCFLSPLTNRRNDEYGGSVQKRARILYEIVEDIQKKCGKDYPIIVRMNGKDGAGVLRYAPGIERGQQIADTVEIAKKLEEMGVAALDISIQDTNVPMQMPKGVALEGAEAVKKAVNIPVLCAGSMEIPDFAENVLEEGKVDFIGTARQLYADPEWPNKLRRGKEDEVRPCIRCMECVNNERHQWYGPLCCTVNPTVGKPEQYPAPAKEKRRVAVVGGGPAGMEAARVCALRGHEVTLFEKRKLGGMLNEASAPDFKADMRKLIVYYENQMKKLKVNVVMKEASKEDLKDFDSVIVASGSNPITLKVPGAQGENVFLATDILNNIPQMGEKVTVIGGGAVGIETGLWLSEAGKQVTIVEMRDQILIGEMIINMAVYQEMIAKYGMKVLTGKTLKSIEKDRVTVTAKDGSEEIIEGDAVIMAAGLKANRTLRDELCEDPDMEVYSAGDTNKPRKIYDAVHEGYIAGMSV